MPYTHVFKHLPNSGEKQIPYKIVLQRDTTYLFYKDIKHNISRIKLE